MYLSFFSFDVLFPCYTPILLLSFSTLSSLNSLWILSQPPFVHTLTTNRSVKERKMKKVVLKLDLHDNKDKQKALKAVSSIPGIDSIAMDMKEQKLTVIGAVDPVTIVSKLRKFWRTEIFLVGPAKEPEKKEEPKKEEAKKEEPKKEEAPKKEEPKKEEPKKEEGEKKKEEPKKEPDPQEQFYRELAKAYKAYNPHMTTHYYVQSAEENPNGCAIV